MFMPRTKTVMLGPLGFSGLSTPSMRNSLPVPLRDLELSVDNFKQKINSISSHLSYCELYIFVSNLSHRMRFRNF